MAQISHDTFACHLWRVTQVQFYGFFYYFFKTPVVITYLAGALNNFVVEKIEYHITL